jgi:hypothetical protein
MEAVVLREGAAAAHLLAETVVVRTASLTEAPHPQKVTVTSSDVASANAKFQKVLARSRATRQRGLMKPMGGPKVWHDVLWAVDALEQAHPALANGAPQLEYPWVTATGVVQWPARHLAVAASMGNPASNLTTRLVQFALLLARRFDEIFP